MNGIFKILLKFLDFLGFSNLFLAIAVFLSTLQGGFVFENIKEAAFSFSIVNFTAAFILYNLQRIYQSVWPTTDERLLWYRRNKKWIFTIAILLAIIFINSFESIFFHYTQGIYVYSLCALMSLIYFLPPINLRKIKLVKQFAIAFVWIIVCCVIPFLFHGNKYSGMKSITKEEYLYILSQFCFISALCIPFDIRDIEKDTIEGTPSIPVVFGIKKSKIFAIVLMLIYLIPAFFVHARGVLFVRISIVLISTLLILQTTPNRHRYYFIYLTDGIIVLQAILIYLL